MALRESGSGYYVLRECKDLVHVEKDLTKCGKEERMATNFVPKWGAGGKDHVHTADGVSSLKLTTGFALPDIAGTRTDTPVILGERRLIARYGTRNTNVAASSRPINNELCPTQK